MLRVFLWLIALSVFVSPVSAQDRVAPEAARVSLEARDQDVKEAIRAVFSKTTGSFSVSQDVSGKVNLSLKDVAFQTALDQVLRQASATYRLEEGVYVIVPRVTSPDVRNVEGVRIENLEVAEAVKRLPGDFRVEIAPGVAGQVTVLSAPKGSAAVEEIARQVDARVETTESGYRLVPKNTLRKPVAVLRQKDADLRALVTELMTSTGVNFVISTGIAGSVTVNLTNTDVQTAVESLLAPIGGKILLRQGVFIVSVR